MSVTSFDKFIFVCGGNRNGYRSTASVEKYSIETDTWTLASPMKFKRENFSVVAHEKYLYAIGGIDCSTNIAVKEVL